MHVPVDFQQSADRNVVTETLFSRSVHLDLFLICIPDIQAMPVYHSSQRTQTTEIIQKNYFSQESLHFSKLITELFPFLSLLHFWWIWSFTFIGLFFSPLTAFCLIAPWFSTQKISTSLLIGFRRPI